MGNFMTLHGSVIAILIVLILIAPLAVRAAIDLTIWLMGYGDSE